MNLPHFEDGFTKSGKGLLTIFFIGIAHQLLNVTFATKKISIPWFPIIEINNLSGISVIFTMFVGYSIYRYSLHNIESICICLNRSLLWALNSLRITRLITTSEGNANEYMETLIREGATPVSEDCCVLIKLYPEGTSVPKLSATIYLSFNSLFSVYCFISMHKSIENKLNHVLRVLNLNPSHFDKRADLNMELSTRVIGFWSTLTFFILSIIFLPLAALSNKKSFDVLLPLLSNIGLFIYLIL